MEVCGHGVGSYSAVCLHGRVSHRHIRSVRRASNRAEHALEACASCLTSQMTSSVAQCENCC